jgi:hypothetical protein
MRLLPLLSLTLLLLLLPLALGALSADDSALDEEASLTEALAVASPPPCRQPAAAPPTRCVPIPPGDVRRGEARWKIKHGSGRGSPNTSSLGRCGHADEEADLKWLIVLTTRALLVLLLPFSCSL